MDIPEKLNEGPCCHDNTLVTIALVPSEVLQKVCAHHKRTSHTDFTHCIQTRGQGGREGGREGRREGGREGGREGERERGREGGREGGLLQYGSSVSR